MDNVEVSNTCVLNLLSIVLQERGKGKDIVTTAVLPTLLTQDANEWFSKLISNSDNVTCTAVSSLGELRDEISSFLAIKTNSKGGCIFSTCHVGILPRRTLEAFFTGTNTQRGGSSLIIKHIVCLTYQWNKWACKSWAAKLHGFPNNFQHGS